MAKPAPRRRSGEWASTLRFLLLLGVAFYALRAFVVAPFSIPSSSMRPGLIEGDHLLVAKWPYGYSRASLPGGPPVGEGRLWGRLPARGDVVVFKHPVTGADWIKRVIGLPGDRVAVRNGALILNGAPVPRDRIADWTLELSANAPCRAQGDGTRADGRACRYPRYRETYADEVAATVLDQGVTPGDDRAEIAVPPGQLLVMGDNRDDSLDGRFAPELGGVGLLPLDRLVGRAALIFFSTDGSAEWLKPWTWITAARPERIGSFL